MVTLYLPAIKIHGLETLQGAPGKGPAGHARPLQPGDLPQPLLRQLPAGIWHEGRPRVAVVPAQSQGDKVYIRYSDTTSTLLLTMKPFLFPN